MMKRVPVYAALLAALMTVTPALAQDANQQMIEAARQMRALADQSADVLPADQIAELRRTADEMERSAREEMAAEAASAQATATAADAPAPEAGAYPARENWLAGKPSCAGFTVDNYRSYSYANDVQLSTMCAGAYNYYAMYLRAIAQGYSQADSDRTYAAFNDSAKVADHYYEANKAN